MDDIEMAASPWTCPFCALLCDGFQVDTAASPLALRNSDCPRARAALRHFDATPGSAQPLLAGRPTDLDSTVAAAARLLAVSVQPLFGGLGTDVAGARALYRLACACGAICDAAQGQALMTGVQALQDRGGFSTTLAEVRTRADLLLCLGGLPTERYPEFLPRVGILPGDARLQVLDDGAPPQALFESLAQLAALVDGRRVAAASPALVALAERLRAAKYAVLVYETGRLPAQGGLLIEMAQRVVASLNRKTRAATLALGGGDGASTVNQVFAWLSGLPLRTRAGARGLEHEPLRFDAARLLDDGAVDLLLWVSSYGPEPACPAPRRTLPRIVLGHPAQASADVDVFIPVSTPGIGSDGHVFRTDGSVLMPLHALRPDTLPTVGTVLQRIHAALQALRERAVA